MGPGYIGRKIPALCNITTWGELVSESGASCFRVSLMLGELSFNVGRVVLG